MKSDFLFEVSWEVCNKVGGINTVLRTKIRQAKNNFGENYILIGPWVSHNQEFVENKTPFAEAILKELSKKNIQARIGYWDIDNKPLTILISFENRYNVNELLYYLWKDFGVDSYQCSHDYLEPTLFSTVAAEVIQILSQTLLKDKMHMVGQFHEWLCGAGLLYLKKNSPKIATVFTTHATVLGRTLGGSGVDIYSLPSSFNPEAAAKKYHVSEKHTMEKASAREADCFNAVSDIVADECYLMLGEYPARLVFNGIDVEKTYQETVNLNRKSIRAKIFDVANKITGQTFSENTLILITSGRFEFHNKGYDIFLKSLAKLQMRLKEKAPQVLALFLIAEAFYTQEEGLLNATTKETQGILTHRLRYPDHDAVMQTVAALGLNQHDTKVKVIYCPAYLEGHDGVFDMSYQTVLAASDLTVFASYYEPWGYTPLESIAYSVPTITTDLAGFGVWVKGLMNVGDSSHAAYVLDYRNRKEEDVVNSLCEQLEKITHLKSEQREEAKKQALSIAKLADWKLFYENYLESYEQAVSLVNLDQAADTVIHEKETAKPKFHRLQRKIILPEPFQNLKELAYNLWWTWNKEAEELFSDLHPVLWEKTNHNPVQLLNLVSGTSLKQKIKDQEYLKKYDQVIKAFREYCHPEKVGPLNGSGIINVQHPVVFFCLEYGLTECLPIYSGGLGILAGDYLKTISDLDIPFIAVGLFYKEGYFSQTINNNGEQVDLFNATPSGQLPMEPVTDEDGQHLIIAMELLDKVVYIKVWKVKVGRVNLYLLDTDLSENNQQMRQITNRLYIGTRDNRILQELILGIGGVKFVTEYLDIKPAFYHLNEGHSVFLLAELVRKFYEQGYSFYESFEAVKSSTIFTTHTSVPAGNEIYYETSIGKYLEKFSQTFEVSPSSLFDYGLDPNQETKSFSLTALALRFSTGINAVSEIHRRVVQRMWNKIWPGFLVSETPIENITNGVHVQTWLGPAIKQLYQKYLVENWVMTQYKTETWQLLEKVSETELWKAHQLQKRELLEVIKEKVICEYTARGENEGLINATLDHLKENVLCIGLARRFAAYKRHYLILKDKERLIKLLTNTEKPAVLIVAGKAHPSDPIGKELIRNLMATIRDPQVKGHIIFLENYDVELAKFMVQGIDVWLNTPILYTEACGTSGMKVGINGGLNFSIPDGWWSEAYKPEIGFLIKTAENEPDANKRDEMEELFLLETLEGSIIPLYYDQKDDWMKKMKQAMQFIATHYNTQRMTKDYFEKLYRPVATYAQELFKNNAKKLKELAKWKQGIRERFKTVSIKTVLIDGIKNNDVKAGGAIKVKLLLNLGKCKPEELKTEFVLVKKNNGDVTELVKIIPLTLQQPIEGEIATYVCHYDAKNIEFDAYSARVYPYHPLLFHHSDVGMIYWE